MNTLYSNEISILLLVCLLYIGDDCQFTQFRLNWASVLKDSMKSVRTTGGSQYVSLELNRIAGHKNDGTAYGKMNDTVQVISYNSYEAQTFLSECRIPPAEHTGLDELTVTLQLRCFGSPRLTGLLSAACQQGEPVQWKVVTLQVTEM